MDALWGILPFLFFLFVFVLLPRMQQQKAHEELIRQFTAIQRKRKSRLIAIVHRQEPMGILGIPNLRYIDLNDSEDVLEAIRRTPPTTPLEMVLHTPGGLVLPALQIARAVKAHPARTTIFVPHYAMSGGTLIAMAADEIIMSEHAALGPIDPQIGGLPAASVLRVTQEKDANSTDDYTLILADVGEMAIRQLQSAAYELLSGNVSDNAAMAAAEQLSSGRWTHDYPIVAAHARELGLNVSTEMPDDIMHMMALFPNRLSGSSVKSVEPEAAEARLGRRRGRVIGPGVSSPPLAAPPATGYLRMAPVRSLGDMGATDLNGLDARVGSRGYTYGPWRSQDLADATRHAPSDQNTPRFNPDADSRTTRQRRWFQRS